MKSNNHALKTAGIGAPKNTRDVVEDDIVFLGRFPEDRDREIYLHYLSKNICSIIGNGTRQKTRRVA